MGQIFYACIYDVENRNRLVCYVDKFHANCYAHSWGVYLTHYLLRQKPYNVMWGGDYMAIDNNLGDVSKREDLLGLSTYLSYKDFESNNENLEEKSYYNRVKFIDENSKLWKSIDIDLEEKHSEWERNSIVKYNGFLVNHTKKLAIDLVDYYEQSKVLNDDGVSITAIDLVPVLTETGGGAEMAFFNGVTLETTEDMAGKWCGDLLQIVDELPQDYELINCCFSEYFSKSKYCYYKFGVNENDYLLKDNERNLFIGVSIGIFGGRSIPSCVKIEKEENGIRYIPIKAKDVIGN